MNKLLAIIFSFQLIITPVALAQSTSSNSTGYSLPGAQETSSSFSSGQYKANTSGPDGFSQAIGGAGVPFWINQILAIGTSLIGADILTKCPLGGKQASLWLFMIGSLGSIVSELVMSFNQHDAHKKLVSDLVLDEEKMKQGGTIQKDSLTAARKGEDETKTVLETRIAINSAIAAIYVAATIAAIIEFNATTAESVASFGIAGNAYDTNGCQGGGGGAFNKLIAAAWSAGTSFVGQGGKISMIAGQIPSVLALLGMTETLSNVVFLFYEKAAARIVTFGVASALEGGVIAGLGERLITVNANIAKIDHVIANLPKDDNAMTPPPEGETTGDSSGGGDKTTPPKLLPKAPVKPLNCVAKDLSSVSPAACREPYRSAQINPRPDFKLDLLNNTMNSAQNMVNALASGNVGKAKLEAAGIANNAARLRSIRDDLLKKTNDKLIAEGKKPIDFNKAVQNQMNGMVSDLNKVVAAKGIDVAALSKSMGETKNSKDSKTTASPDVVAPSVTGSVAPGVDLSTSTEEPQIAEGVTSPEKNLNDYVLNEQDVSKDKGVSIFKQLSNRYILNYKKIFKTLDEPKSETPPLAPSAKK